MPDPFEHAFVGLVAARAVTAAATLGVFDALAAGPATAQELGERAGLDPHGADALLTALVALGYARVEEGRYAAEPVVEELLVHGAPEGIASFVGAQSELHWDVLARLEEAVRSGRPFAFHEEHGDSPHWEGYMRGLFEISRAEQEWNASLAPLEEPERLVDVAGGHGGFSMAMCRRFPSLSATVLDLPAAAAVGSKIVEERGFAERVRFLEGDVFAAGLGEGLDAVSVFNLIHHLPEERDRDLVRMALAALKPGGWLLVGDTEKPAPEAASGHGALSSLLFYAWSGSRNFEVAEVVGWLEDAGFAEVRTERNPRSPWRIVVLGRSPE